MKFLSHRGVWQIKSEQNTLAAFEKSFMAGFGCELDIRDCEGQLVISHDLPATPYLLLEAVFECYKNVGFDVPIAINIKADGLQTLLKELIDKYAITNYFAFDMSVPDTLGYEKNQLKFFTRHSEYEPDPALYEQAEGVWLDCFHHDWWQIKDVAEHLKTGKLIALVSPELHQRKYQQVWEIWRQIEREFATNNLMLCTDYPAAAKEFFND